MAQYWNTFSTLEHDLLNFHGIDSAAGPVSAFRLYTDTSELFAKQIEHLP